MAEWTATKEEIERWLMELGEKCDRAEFQTAYKAGWRDALSSVMAKMDDARRASGQRAG